MGCTCNWNATFKAPPCPVHSPPPVCTCERCPCCGGAKAAPAYRIEWVWRPENAPYYTSAWSSTGTTSTTAASS